MSVVVDSKTALLSVSVTSALIGSLMTSIYYLWKQNKTQKEILSSRVSTLPFLEELERDFHVSAVRLYSIMKDFLAEMDKGLSSDAQGASTIKMIPSFVSTRPTGSESGAVIALDLGGTNFRVVLVSLEGNRRVAVQQKEFRVSDALKTGPVDNLFDFLADCVHESFNEWGIKDKDIKLGFTFSFPVKQTAINQGSLITWTKGFSNPGLVGEEVVGFLQRAFNKKKIKVTVSALVNDTVGTLIAHSYQDPQCYLGVILGTGTNAAYVEKIQNIPKWQGPVPESETMMINMEWGGYDSDIRGRALPITTYDIVVDETSVNRGKQIYEKMISGMYLGEITRNVLVRLVEKGHLFDGIGSEKLQRMHAFESKLMSRIERDHSQDLRDTKVVLEELMEIPKTTYQDRLVVKRVCELVGIRAARLSAVGIAAVVTQIKRHNLTVGIDGSVFEHYPHFANRCRDALSEILGMASEGITLALARDGSGTGAGLIALLA